jgi:hypothetical protein
MSKNLIIIFLLVSSASFIHSQEESSDIDDTSDTPEISDTINVVKNIDITNINDASSLWRIFLDNPDSKTGVDIILKLGAIGKGNRSVIDNLNNYLKGKNLLFRSGESVDYTVISACISAVMELGDSSSYSALFSVLYAGYPEIVASEAQGALEVIPGDLQQFLVNTIINNPPEEKFAAFRAGLNSDRLNVSQRGQLAELALEQGMNTVEENINMTVMRYSAVLQLTQLSWTRANDLAIRHYYRVQHDYLQDVVSKERFIEAIACLGAVGNSDAALVLGLYLGLINAGTRNTGSFDADITTAVVQALGKIGYNAVFDHLLYVSNLPYPEEIQTAAREAVARLKW